MEIGITRLGRSHLKGFKKNFPLRHASNDSIVRE
jgi:hypothetical protein